MLRENIRGVLDKLRHEQISAIVVDYRHSNTNVLELIVNVRDVDEQIPVVVIGELGDEVVRETLAGQKQTAIVEDAEDSKKLAERLEQILTNLENTR